MIGTSISARSLLLATGMAEGASSHGAAGSGLALFLLGLITGVGAVVAAFFAYLHVIRRREIARRLEGSGDEKFVPDEFEDSSSTSADTPRGGPQRMPWERPEDWWRNPDDGESTMH